jgi:hypothetical protein
MRTVHATASTMFRKIGMVILLVSDLRKMVAFYKDILGMKVKHESEEWIELSTKEGSTKLALHLTEKRTEDRRWQLDTLTHSIIISCSPALIQRRIFLQSKYGGADPSLHIPLSFSLGHSILMQSLLVELCILMTIVASMKKSDVLGQVLAERLHS